MSASEVETSQCNETAIEIVSNFENVDSVWGGETALVSVSRNEDEMQVWTQRTTEKTNKEVSDLRKEKNKNLEKKMKEMKDSRREHNLCRAEDIKNKKPLK